MLSSASDKAKLFAKNFSKKSNLDNLGISLPVFSSRTNLILHIISVTPNIVKKVCWKDCWKVSLVVPVFKNVGERSTAKNYCPASLLSVVSKVVEKPVNNKTVDYLEKCGLFSDFQYGFRSSQSTADLLTVVSDRVAKSDRAIRAVELDKSKPFGRVWPAGLLHKLKSYGISGQIFDFISSFFQ